MHINSHEAYKFFDSVAYAALLWYRGTFPYGTDEFVVFAKTLFTRRTFDQGKTGGIYLTGQRGGEEGAFEYILPQSSRHFPSKGGNNT